MTLFKRLINKYFPELQKGDIVVYKGRKQRVIGIKDRMHFIDAFRTKYIPCPQLSIDGYIYQKRADGILLRKIGHKDIPYFEIGDIIISQAISDAEWYNYPEHVPVGSRKTITNNTGIIAHIERNKPITGHYCDWDETIWVKFEVDQLPVPLSPYHLDKPTDYDII